MHVVLAVDNHLFVLLQYLTDDDGLVGDFSGYPIRVEEVHHLEQIGLKVTSQLVQSWSIQLRTTEAIIDVFFDEHVSISRNLPFQLGDLHLDSTFSPFPL